MRRALLTTHIVLSVALLGDVAGFLAVAIRAAGTDDPELAAAARPAATSPGTPPTCRPAL